MKGFGAMIIFVDLDDTLLPKSQKLSPYTIEILKECQKKGHKLVFSTARSVQAAMPVFKQIKADYMVLNGGSSIYNNSLNLLYENRIGKRETKEIISYLEGKGLYTLLVEAGDGFLTDNKDFVDKYHAKLVDFNKLDLDHCNCYFKAFN